MINTVKSAWFVLTRTSSKDPDEARQEYMTRVILAVMSVMSIFFVIILSFGYYFSVVSGDLFALLLIMCAFFIIGWYFSGHGRWKLCRYIPMILFLFTGIYGIFIDGLYSSAMLVFILAIMLSIIFFQRIGQIVIIAISLVSFISLSLLHYFGYLTAFRIEAQRITNRMIIVPLIFITIAALLRFLISQMKDALKISRTRGEELEGINEELQAAMEELEATTEEFEAQNEELLRTNRELEESEERFRSMIQSSSDMIFVLGPNGTFIYESPSTERILGYKRDYFIGQSPLTLIHPEDIEIVLKELDEVYKLVNTGLPTEFRLRRADGAWTYLEALGSNLLDNKAVNGVVITARDISERKRAEENLIKSEKRFRDLAELLPQVVFEIDLKGCFTYVNRFAFNLFGYSEADFELGLNALDMISPSDRKIAAINIEKMLNNEMETGCGYRAIHKNGKEFPIIIYSTPVYTGGNVVGLRGVLVDITEHKRAEEALKVSEKQYRSVIENIQDVFYRSDINGRLLMVSPSGVKMFGYDSTNEIIGIFIDTFWADNKERELALVQMKLHSSVKDYEALLKRKDGSTFNGSFTAHFYYDDKGNILGTEGIIRDITKRKKAEAALQLSEVTYREIFNTINDTIWIHDVETFEFLDVNKNVTEMFGYTVKEAIKLNLDDISSGVPPYIKETGIEYLKKAAAGQPQIFEWESKHKDGHIFLTEVNLKRAIIAGKECILAIERDITKRKLAEEQRDTLQAQLLQAQKMESVGRLAGGVAHDFNNMLSAILGHTELAMMKYPPSDPIFQDLKVIKESAIRSADLTRQLLAFARKQTIAPKVLNLNDQITSMLKMLLRLIGEDIDLVWKPGASLWETKIDPSQLDQLLANLCVNARDAISGVGKVTIETENTVFDRDYCTKHKGFIPGEYVMFAVSDDGIGMTKEILNHLFEPFFTTKEVGKGTGLGLATVYGIVKQNEGFINVYSEPGKGTTFRIYLPRFTGDEKQQPTEIQSVTTRGNGEMILLVEDEEMILNVTKIMLEELGYTVLTASTPGEALLKAKENSAEIKLLITDVIMPEMNGRDLANMIYEIKPDIKCLFISGYTADAIAHRGVLDEGVFFLEKPFSIKDLGEKIHKLL